jgi:hypothetical protein
MSQENVQLVRRWFQAYRPVSIDAALRLPPLEFEL